ncbi:MAG: hemolysin family protein [Planctomycetes bacterium]|nr:hemolysin family protein [Planctomycetota bacterium]
MVVAVIALVVLLLFNGLCAMAELAMMTSRQSRLQQQAAKGSKGALAALALARQPTKFLSTVQVAITLIGILAGAFGENRLSGPLQEWIAKTFPIVAKQSDTIALVVVVLLITYFSLVFGELVPKRIALAYPEAVAATISRPLSVLSFVAALPVKVLSWSTDAILSLLRIRSGTGDDVSEDDVRSLVSRAATTGVFTPQEHKLFQRVFRMGDLTVRDLMVPRPEIVWIDKGTPTEALKVLVGTSPHSHFPIGDGDLDKLIGVVHIKDLIAYGLLMEQDFDVSAVLQKPIFVPESMPVLKLLDQFQQSRNHVAFVVNEYGGTQGLITLNDVLSALVGDVSRKGEQSAPRAVKREDGSVLVDGRMAMHDLVALLNLSPEAASMLPDVSTAAGLVLSLFGRIPEEGEKKEWLGRVIEVVDMDGTRIDKVLILVAKE